MGEFCVLNDLFKTVSIRGHQVNSSEYLDDGEIPIIDQGAELFCGFTNDVSKVLSMPRGVVIFGDHTRVVKYYEGDFVAGADGTKVLKPLDLTMSPRFLYYIVDNCIHKMTNLGYSRHFKELKSMRVWLPPFKEQERIVEILSDCDKAIELTAQLMQSEKKVLDAKVFSVVKEASKNVTELQNFVSFDKGQKVSLSENDEGQPYLGSQALEGNITDYSEDTLGIKCLPSDVLLLWDGENAGRASTNLKGIVSSTVMRLRPHNKQLNEFISGILRLNFRRIQTMREGSGVPHLPRDFASRFKLPNLDLERQLLIGNFFADARRSNEIFTKQLALFKKQKRGLMQRLLNETLPIKG